MQAPKLILFPLGLMPPSGWIPSVVPLQIMRIGELVLVAVPAEVTVVAGLRLRRVVADELRVDIDDVLVQGYANATPSTSPPRRNTTSSSTRAAKPSTAVTHCRRICRSSRSSPEPWYPVGGLDRGPAPVDKSGLQPDLVPPVPADRPIAGHAYGDVLKQPGGSHRPGGQTVTVDFVGAHPNNDFRHGGTYLEVQRREGGTWKTVADDNDWSTEFRWARPAGSTDTSRITITWRPAAGTSGTYRIKYNGNSRDGGGGRVREISGTSRTFDVG